MTPQTADELAAHHAAVRAQVMREYVREDEAPSGNVARQPVTAEIEQRAEIEIGRAEEAVALAQAAKAEIPDRQEAAQRALKQGVTGEQIRAALAAIANVEADALAADRALERAEAELVETRERVHREMIEALRKGAAEAAGREHEAAIRMREAVAERQRWRHAARRILGDAQRVVPASPWISEFGPSDSQLTTKFDHVYGE